MSASAHYCATCGAKKGRCSCTRDAQSPPPTSTQMEVETQPGRPAASPPFDLEALQRMITEAVAGGIKNTGLTEKLDELEARTAKAELEVKKIPSMESRLDAIEARLTGPTAGNAGTRAFGFQPSFLELKGWCDWASRKENGVSHSQATRLVAAIKAKLPGTMASDIGEMQLRGLHNFSVRLPVLNPEKAYEIKGTIQDIIKDSEQTFLVNGKVPYIVAEKSQETAARYKRVGDILEAVRKTIADKDLDTELEVLAEWSTCSVYVKPTCEERHFIIGDLNRGGEPVLHERNIAKYLHVGLQAFQAYMQR